MRELWVGSSWRLVVMKPFAAALEDLLQPASLPLQPDHLEVPPLQKPPQIPVIVDSAITSETARYLHFTLPTLRQGHRLPALRTPVAEYTESSFSVLDAPLRRRAAILPALCRP